MARAKHRSAAKKHQKGRRGRKEETDPQASAEKDPHSARERGREGQEGLVRRSQGVNAEAEDRSS
jgi:hypothetical protein